MTFSFRFLLLSMICIMISACSSMKAYMVNIDQSTVRSPLLDFQKTGTDTIAPHSGLRVNWQVAINDDDNLFKSYCPEGKTPCVLLRNPTLNKVKKIIGESSLAEWEQFTGEWSYQ